MICLRRAMSAVLVHESGIVENVGVAVGIEQQANSVQYVFTFSVSVATNKNFGCRPTARNIGRRQCHTLALHGLKCERSRCNRVASPFLSKVISTFVSAGRQLEIR